MYVADTECRIWVFDAMTRDKLGSIEDLGENNFIGCIVWMLTEGKP